MADGVSNERPVLLGQVRQPVPYNPINRGGSKVNVPSHGSQGLRLGGRFEDIESAFSEQITLTQSLGASDPQLVVVFEAIDERADLARVAQLPGLEILAEVEQEYEPDPNFPRRTANQDLPVTGCLHAVCINEQSRGKILAQWRKWQTTGQVDRGYAPLRDIFAHPQGRTTVGSSGSGQIQ